MKPEDDLLARASRALRERHDGREDPATRTRERILASVRQKDKRRSFWFKASIPGGVLLLGTTAWAQATHQWPAIWRTVGDIFSLPVSNEGNSEQQLAAGRAMNMPSTTRSESTSEAPASSADTQADAFALTDADATETTTAEAADVSIDAHTLGDTRTSPGRRKRTLTKPELDVERELERARSTASEPPSEPEIAAFRAANDLDFKQRNLGGALAAYRLYLRDYPAGRFVPEARYNSAIILLKLGKREEARRELTPFASGKYGAHRQARAAKLLHALEQSEP